MIFLLFFVIAQCAIAAEKIPVDIHADQLIYHQHRNLISASGNVEISIESMRISANRLWLNMADKSLWASGNVRIQENAMVFRGQFLFYDISSSNMALQQLQTTQNNAWSYHPLYLRAESLYGSLNGDSSGYLGLLTTCDLDHYHIEAERFVYLPEERLEGHDVWFKAGQFPLLWTPYYVFRLDDEPLRLPVIGQNQTEGWFIKSGHPYGVNNLVSGTAYVDVMQKKGTGLGALNRYTLGQGQQGAAYLYYLREQDTGITDWIGRLDHVWRLDSRTTLNGRYDMTRMYLVPGGRLERETVALHWMEESPSGNNSWRAGQQLDFLSRVSEQTIGVYWEDRDQNGAYDYRLQEIRQHRKNEFQRLSFQQALGSSWEATLRLNFYRNGDVEQASDEKLLTMFSLMHTDSPWYKDARLDIETYTDLDRQLYQDDNTTSYLEKLPVVQVNLKPVNTGWFLLHTRLGLGRYHEGQYVSSIGKVRDFQTERLWSVLTFFKRIFLNRGTQLYLSRHYEQYLYTPGDSRFVMDDRVDLYSQWEHRFRNTIHYQSRFQAGQSPFYFDTRGNEIHHLTDQFSFFQGTLWRWDVTGGYNFITESYDNVITEMTIRPDSHTRYRFKTGYSLEEDEDKFEDFLTDVSFQPDQRTGFVLSNVVDLNQGLLKRASSEVLFGLGQEKSWESRWDFRIHHSYEYSSGRYLLRVFEVHKDLHCWTARFRYDQFRDEYLLTFTLKAWKETPIKLYGGREGFRMETEFERSPSRI